MATISPQPAADDPTRNSGAPKPSFRERFDTRRVVITALVVFLISGVGGALLQRWITRARPTLIITAVGFRGPDDPIKVSEKVLRASRDDAWGPHLKPYETFQALLDRHANAAELSLRLSKAIGLCEDWLKRNPEATEQIGIAALRDHPYFQDNLVGSSLFGMNMRGELGKILTGLDGVTKSPRLGKLSHSDEGWVITLTGKQKTMVPLGDTRDEEQDADARLMAESLVRGVRANVNHYTQRFIDASNAEVRSLSDLKAGIEEVILPEARLAVEVTAYNDGGQALAIKPHIVLQLNHEQFRGKVWVLAARQADKQTAPRTALDEAFEAQVGRPKSSGRDVVVEQFLPREGAASPYIALPPGQVRAVTFIGRESVGSLGVAILQIYRTGVLNCRIAAVDLADTPIRSMPAVFGDRISEEDQTRLLAQLDR